MAGLDSAIPIQVGGGVRVGTCHGRVVAVGNTVVARILPIDTPAADRACAVVSDFDLGIEAAAPLVLDGVLASSKCRY